MKGIKIDWLNGDWAFACGFSGNDLSVAFVASGQCGSLCFKTSDCTHFTWTRNNNGTCQLKRGSVTKNDATPIADPSMICGIVAAHK